MFELPNYVQVPHEVFDRMHELSGRELKVLMAICRKTLGHHKMSDSVSYSQITEITQISRPNVIPAVKKLLDLDKIEVHKKKGRANYYTLKCGCKPICIEIVQLEEIGSIDTRLASSPDTRHTKERVKERDNTPYYLAEYFDNKYRIKVGGADLTSTGEKYNYFRSLLKKRTQLQTEELVDKFFNWPERRDFAFTNFRAKAGRIESVVSTAGRPRQPQGPRWTCSRCGHINTHSGAICWGCKEER